MVPTPPDLLMGHHAVNGFRVKLKTMKLMQISNLRKHTSETRVPIEGAVPQLDTVSIITAN